MTSIAERLRQGVDPDDIQETESSMDIGANEIERLQTENWQLKQALGYPIPADKDTPNNPWRCGVCHARSLECTYPTCDCPTRNGVLCCEAGTYPEQER